MQTQDSKNEVPRIPKKMFWYNKNSKIKWLNQLDPYCHPKPPVIFVFAIIQKNKNKNNENVQREIKIEMKGALNATHRLVEERGSAVYLCYVFRKKVSISSDKSTTEIIRKTKKKIGEVLNLRVGDCEPVATAAAAAEAAASVMLVNLLWRYEERERENNPHFKRTNSCQMSETSVCLCGPAILRLEPPQRSYAGARQTDCDGKMTTKIK